MHRNVPGYYHVVYEQKSVEDIFKGCSVMQDTTLKCYGKLIKVSLNTKFNDDSSQTV